MQIYYLAPILPDYFCHGENNQPQWATEYRQRGIKVMSEVSAALMQLGFGSVGVLLAVCACCLSAVAVARTKQALRDMR